MQKMLLTAALLLASLSPAPARNLTKVLIFNGACTRFEYDGSSSTQFCQDKLSVNQFDDGRTSFTVILKRIGSPDVLNTMTGQATGTTTRGITSEPIDGFIYTFSGEPARSVKATGSCTFGNLYKPPSFVECSLKLGTHPFEMRFETDASAPTTLNPR